MLPSVPSWPPNKEGKFRNAIISAQHHRSNYDVEKKSATTNTVVAAARESVEKNPIRKSTISYIHTYMVVEILIVVAQL